MFGDMLGNMEEKQKELKSKLSEIFVEAQAGDGAVKVTANANREITNIQLDSTKFDTSATEELEDLLMVAVNRAIEAAAAKEGEATEGLLKDLLPPGLGNLGNLFG